MKDFLKKEEEKAIIQAIKDAELNTSGEIRVHLEKELDGDIMDAAVSTFYKLRMDRTAESNAVLIYIVPEEKKFAIIGDKGISRVVPEGYWEDVRNIMQQHFRENQFAKGIQEAVAQVGIKLKRFFPWQTDDVNELPDEISYRSK